MAGRPAIPMNVTPAPKSTRRRRRAGTPNGGIPFLESEPRGHRARRSARRPRLVGRMRWYHHCRETLAELGIRLAVPIRDHGYRF